MTVITTAFKPAGEYRLKELGLTMHPMAVIEHPFASLSASEVKQMAAQVVGVVEEALLER